MSLSKPQRWLGNAVLILFLAVFFLILVQILFFNTAFGYSPLLQGALLCCWLVFVCGVVWFGVKHKAAIYRHKNKILWGVLVFVFGLQLAMGLFTRQTPDHDYGKIYNGALIFATQGADSAAFAGYSKYFHHFTNNVGQFLFVQLLFKGIHALGLSCYYDVFVLVGHLCFTGAIYFTFRYTEKAFGTGAALLALLLYVCYLPVYFQSSIAYTDTYSIWIPPFLLYAAQKAQAAAPRQKVFWWAAMGLALAVGKEIKATVLITGIALLVQMLLEGKWRQKLAFLLTLCLVFAAAAGAVRAYTYAVLLDEERVQQEAWPLTYWLMMGLQGDGAYNHTDEWIITGAAADVDARRALNLQYIQDRLQNMGPGGYVQLLHRKTNRTFGSGNGEVNYLLVRQPNNPGHWVYRLISSDGAWFRYFDNLSQVVYLSFYVLALGGVLLALRRKKAAFLRNFAPFLALVGFFLFMMLWESNHRLLVNQWPLYTVAAAAGASLMLPPVARLPQRAKALLQKRRGKPKISAD